MFGTVLLFDHLSQPNKYLFIILILHFIFCGLEQMIHSPLNDIFVKFSIGFVEDAAQILQISLRIFQIFIRLVKLSDLIVSLVVAAFVKLLWIRVILHIF